MATITRSAPEGQYLPPSPPNRRPFPTILIALLLVIAVAGVAFVFVRPRPASDHGSTKFATPSGRIDGTKCTIGPVVAPSTGSLIDDSAVTTMLDILQQAVYHRDISCLYTVDRPNDSEAEHYITYGNYNPFGSGTFKSTLVDHPIDTAHPYVRTYDVTVNGYSLCGVQVGMYQGFLVFNNGIPQFGADHRRAC